MGLLSKKTPIATVRVAFLDDDQAHIETWVEDGDREAQAYHILLFFLMYYARMLFFLSFRDTAEELIGWMDDAVRLMAETPDEVPAGLARGVRIANGRTVEPRTVWSGTLFTLKPHEYSCSDEKPADPEDADAQRSVLVFLQHLAETRPALERAYLALGISGMHEYYRDIQHWNTTKALHPAPAYGIDYARSVLERAT
ncbi:MAG: hypothetical protein JW733_04505 [Coriobacteriia bacterium]|nr:hypothetical protein [Coriobacteriia bacterium]MBN2847286.1 hypothetical protein [Coriobacteriia bacterium]